MPPPCRAGYPHVCSIDLDGEPTTWRNAHGRSCSPLRFDLIIFVLFLVFKCPRNACRAAPHHQLSPPPSTTTAAPQPVQPELRAKRTKNAARNGERRPRRRWGQHEIDSLIQGVQKHGIGAWATIAADPDLVFDACRTSLDMKDKWRVLTSRRAKSAPDLPIDLASLPRAVNPRWAQDSTRKKILSKSGTRRGNSTAAATGQDGPHDPCPACENSETTGDDTTSSTSAESAGNDHHGSDHHKPPRPLPPAPRRANKRKRAASPGPSAVNGAAMFASPQPVAQPVIRHSATHGSYTHDQTGPIIHVDAALCWSGKPHPTAPPPPRRVISDFTRPPSPLPLNTSRFPFMPLSLLAPQHLIRGHPVAIPSPFDPGTFWFGTARPPQPPDPASDMQIDRLRCFPFGRETTSPTSVSPSAIDFPCYPTVPCAPEWTHPSLVIPRPFPPVAAVEVPLPPPASALVARLLDVMARTRSITSHYWHTRYARDVELRGILAKIERRMNRATVAFASAGDYGPDSAAWVARCTRESNDDREYTDHLPLAYTAGRVPDVPKEFVYHQDFFNTRYHSNEGARYRATALARYVYRGRGATHLTEAPREAELAVREAQMGNNHAWLYGNRNTHGIPVMDAHELAHAAAALDPATREAALALLAHRAFGQVLWFAWLHEELHTLFARYPPLPARSNAQDDFGGRTHRVMPHGGWVTYSHDDWFDEVWGQLRRGKRFLDEVEGRRRQREGSAEVEGKGPVQIERAPKRVERLFSQYRFHWVGEEQVMPFR